jgi:hypothetical protein
MLTEILLFLQVVLRRINNSLVQGRKQGRRWGSG